MLIQQAHSPENQYEDGELKINQWMIDNLEFGFIELDSGVDDIIKILEKRKRTDKEKEAKKEHKKYMLAKEKEAKKIIKPCLNCKDDKSYNIYYSEIKRLRAICRVEAEKNS